MSRSSIPFSTSYSSRSARESFEEIRKYSSSLSSSSGCRDVDERRQERDWPPSSGRSSRTQLVQHSLTQRDDAVVLATQREARRHRATSGIRRSSDTASNSGPTASSAAWPLYATVVS
ncbi:hypothetical protein C9J85_17075 [Haloferax sp. wsp5]|nr:hypothetical protein C9J85_17075 [Haloferax sp. wsp5]